MSIHKEALWLSCKQKTCCSTRIVLVTGSDVWRIARALDTEPWTFLAYYEVPQRPDAFVLDASGQHYCLALAKRASRRTVTPAPCIFLVNTRDGYHRCGLGDLRPAACKSFPADIVDGVLCLTAASGCSCRTWTHADIDLDEEIAVAEWRVAELRDYCTIVARWNERVVARTHAEGELDLDDFCAFLMADRDQLQNAPLGVFA